MTRNQHIFSLASLVNGISFSMILPLLAPIIRQLKLSELQGGAMVSAGALWMAIAALYISKHPAKYSVYQLLMLGFVGMTLTWTLFSGVLLYSLNSKLGIMSVFLLLLVARASTGVFMAMPQIALQSYVMTAFNAEHTRSQAMAKFGALNSLGIVIGPFLTTVFLIGGLQTPLWIAVLLLAVVTILIVFCYEHQDQTQDLTLVSNEPTTGVIPQDQLSPIKDAVPQTDHPNIANAKASIRKMLFWLSLGFYLYVAIVTLNLTAGFYLQDHFQISIQDSAMYFSQCSLIVGISMVCMQVLIARYLTWSLYRLLGVGILAMAMGLIISISTDQLRIFQACYLFYGIAVACLMPAFSTGAAAQAPQHMQTQVASWCTATQALSFVIGPLISTGLYQWHSTLPYGLLIIGLIALTAYAWREKYLATQRNIHPHSLNEKSVDHHAVHQNSR
ncbi:MFS transporter [Acinetobacter sp. 187]|uniref:MFS transporter n=1 Tax=Acinetobacter lanii TaxID=2715163 RepID=UPI001408DFF6|nr:MFS transporter [Acinetobacter lanii]NHC02590.1 MFS transporter [Acinetobacter lanii]